MMFTSDLTMSSFEESLKKLGTDYVDLFLIHWPNPVAYRDRWQQANAESWKAMEELYEAGILTEVGKRLRKTFITVLCTFEH